MLFLNIPALVIIVLAYIWFGLTEVAAIGAVAVNKIPNVVVTMREGARALDPRYQEMAAVYRFSPLDRIRHVLLPQLQPYIAAASRSGIALIWKIVLVVELLGRSNGVGFQIYLNFQLFDVAAILAYTLAFVAIMLPIELLLVQPLERHASRWRQRPFSLRVDIAEKTFRSAEGVSLTALRDLSFEVRARRVRLPARPVGLRQDDDAAHPARPRQGVFRAPSSFQRAARTVRGWCSRSRSCCRGERSSRMSVWALPRERRKRRPRRVV